MFEFELRRKLTLKSADKQIVLIKKRNETINHVFMKAFIWNLYLPEYNDLTIEVPIQDKYKPDVVQLDKYLEKPVFWGEAGSVSKEKFYAIFKRYSDTHFCFGKWDINLSLFKNDLDNILKKIKRKPKIDIINFPSNSKEKFIENNIITISFNDIEIISI